MDLRILRVSLPDVGREEFEDTKGVIRTRKSKKDRQYTGQKRRTKRQTTIYKTYT